MAVRCMSAELVCLDGFDAGEERPVFVGLEGRFAEPGIKRDVFAGLLAGEGAGEG